MFFVRHTTECAGKPDASGRLTGECNCKTAKLDVAARKQLEQLLRKLDGDSIKANEQAEYFALRLDQLAEQISRVARAVRRAAKSSRVRL